MQKPKLIDNATAGLEFQDSSTAEALDGTILRSIFQNDNFGNLFKLVENAGYDLIDDDLSQVAKAVKSLYNSTFTYNTSAIATQTVDDIVLGSDGKYYKALSDGINGDDPVGSVTGDWEEYSSNITQVEFDLKLGDDGKSFTTNGYQKLSNGLIIQWGTVASPGAVVFPIAFPTATINVLTGVKSSVASQTSKAHTASILSITSSGFTVGTIDYNTASEDGYTWFAIGH